jgi:hypothetical protein
MKPPRQATESAIRFNTSTDNLFEMMKGSVSQSIAKKTAGPEIQSLCDDIDSICDMDNEYGAQPTLNTHTLTATLHTEPAHSSRHTTMEFNFFTCC